MTNSDDLTETKNSKDFLVNMAIPAATVIAAVATAAIAPPLSLCALGVYATGFVGMLGVAATNLLPTNSYPRLPAIISRLTPVVAVAAFAALHGPSVAHYRAEKAATVLFDAAQKDCTGRHGLVTKMGDRNVCFYADPAKPTEGRVVFLPPSPNN
ncbi:MAG: hypothetical protein WCD70_03195 [Alphaproteobacteria bacterium]